MHMNWQHDPVIHHLASQLPAPQPYTHQDTYLFLLSSVISQQLSIKVAKAIYNRFISLFPGQYPGAEMLLALDEAQLRSAGLSGAKAAYIQHIARFHLSYPVSFEALQGLPDEEVIALLTQIKGVGKWTAQMVLMFPMDRPDVFPVDDLVIRQQMIRWYGIQAVGKELKQQLTAIAENWRPHRTLACKYLWKSKDLATSIVNIPG